MKVLRLFSSNQFKKILFILSFFAKSLIGFQEFLSVGWTSSVFSKTYARYTDSFCDSKGYEMEFVVTLSI